MFKANTVRRRRCGRRRRRRKIYSKLTQLEGGVCKDCGGGGICAHYHIRKSCKECKRRRAELAAASAQP